MIYQGRLRGTRLAEVAEEESFSPEKPTVTPPAPAPKNPPLRSFKRRSVPHKPPRPFKRRRCGGGAKLGPEVEDSPEKARSVAPPPSSSQPPPPPALPEVVEASPDRSDPKIFRHLPKRWFRYRTLPAWANKPCGPLEAQTPEAAPAEARNTEDEAGEGRKRKGAPVIGDF